MQKLRLVLAAVAILVLAVGTTGNAQPLANLFAVSAAVGADMPMGDFADEDLGSATMGFEGSVAFERMFGESFGLSVGGRYARFGVDTGNDDISANWTAMLADVSGRFFLMPGSAIRPFVTGGLLFGQPKETVEGGTDEVTATYDWVFGFHGGGGVLYLVSETVGVFGVAEFNHMATDGAGVEIEINGVKDPGTYESNINLQWIGIRGGVTIFFGGGQ